MRIQITPAIREDLVARKVFPQFCGAGEPGKAGYAFFEVSQGEARVLADDLLHAERPTPWPSCRGIVMARSALRREIVRGLRQLARPEAARPPVASTKPELGLTERGAITMFNIYAATVVTPALFMRGDVVWMRDEKVEVAEPYGIHPVSGADAIVHAPGYVVRAVGGKRWFARACDLVEDNGRVRHLRLVQAA